MRKRPYFKLGILELERLFKATSEDVGRLETLLRELRFRKTQRAGRLRNQVAQALKDLEPEGPSSSNSSSKEARDPLARSRAEVSGPSSDPAKTTGTSGSAATRIVPSQNQSPGPETSAQTTEGPRPQAGADSILAAWLTLEVLSPQPLQEAEDLRAMNRQLVRLGENPEPWTSPRSGKRGKERAVYWFLHLGEIDLAEATRSLLELFPDEHAEERTETRGTTTMAVVVLDHRGRPILGKTFLSSFAWGYGQVRAGNLWNLAAFPEAELSLRGELERRLIHQDHDGEILPVTRRDIQAVTSWLLDTLNLPPEQVAQGGLAVRVPVWSYAGEAPEPELLNSFFLEDLTRVRKAWRSSDVGPALGSYLAEAPPKPRWDVVRDQGLLKEILAPKHIPRARWPIRGRYPLVLMQQGAVHHATGELRDGGLVGVNGPPGTGKTTLLRDIVAKVVLDRAAALAQFEDPREAFTHVAPMRLGRAYVHLYRLDESLLGHEIVVASSNNKAVENISREIPAADAVAEDFDPPLRYFASIADCVAANGRDEEIVGGDSWGLAAAVLGNKANRSAFTRAFWWHKDRGFAAYLRGIVDGWSSQAKSEEDAPPEVLKLEKAPRSESEALERWGLARKDFLVKLHRIEALTAKLEAAREALGQRAESAAALRRGEDALGKAEDELGKVIQSVEAAAEGLERALRSEREAVEDRAAVLELRPGFFARLFWTRAYRDWRSQMLQAQQRVARERAAKQAADRALDEARGAQTAAEGRLEVRREELETLRHRHAVVEAAIAWGEEVAGDRFADESFWAQEPRRLQTSSPWLAEPLQQARDALFEAAFALHRAFIDAAARRLRHNLGVALAVMQGRPLSEAQEPARRSLWASLFLVVPVVSTTFASVARLFGPLGREQLGWLLLDEAGQAVPQAAVGAMWRARRVVAIGDPLQIEPVVTVAPRLIAAIFQEFSVPAEEWAAPVMSVQTLADRVSWLGTTLLQDDGDLWVGCPLRVHRRCEEPMFSISNRIAYGGLMVQATPKTASPLGKVLGESRWIDVDGAAVGDPAMGKWSPREGEVAAELLARALDAKPADPDLSDPDLFFITPFRLVAQNLRRLLQSKPEIRDKLSGSPWRWVQDRVGTIHTFQGKEAEAVVLVLGAPLEASAGARRWAGYPPNLLNVAVSRARQRLYVVGSHRSWKDVGVFRTLASVLPVHSTA